MTIQGHVLLNLTGKSVRIDMPQLCELIKVNNIWDAAKLWFWKILLDQTSWWSHAIDEISNEEFKELMEEGLFTDNDNVSDDPKYEWAT